MIRISSLIKRHLHDRKNYRFNIKNYVELCDLRRAADTMNTLRHAQILDAQERPSPERSRITIIAPHPDDEIMGPGGTLILARRAGCDVHTVFLTRGSSPGGDANQASESEMNALQLGYSTTFLDFPLGKILLDDETVRRFAAAISESRPDYLWIPFLLDDHDDHRRASHLLQRAAQTGCIIGKPRIWAYQVYTSLPANVTVDITEAADAKREAIERYASQLAHRDWGHYVLGLNAYNARFLSGSVRSRFVETFFDLPFDDYVDLCGAYFREPWQDCYLGPGYSTRAGLVRQMN